MASLKIRLDDRANDDGERKGKWHKKGGKLGQTSDKPAPWLHTLSRVTLHLEKKFRQPEW
jgi:hypothetical protein